MTMADIFSCSMACAFGDARALQEALTEGCDASQRALFDPNAWWSACTKRGGFLSSRPASPLHLVLRNRHFGLVARLLAVGADAREGEGEGCALDSAVGVSREMGGRFLGQGKKGREVAGVARDIARALRVR